MSAFVSEIRALATFITPKGWLKCEGQELLIKNYPDLFSVIGINYGGDGLTTFNIPNLVGRSILGQDNGTTYPLGSKGGIANQTLTKENLPAHNHDFKVSSLKADLVTPSNEMAIGGICSDLNGDSVSIYTGNAPDATLTPATIGNTGEGTSFSILSPYLAMNYFISLYGVLPTAEVA